MTEDLFGTEETPEEIAQHKEWVEGAGDAAIDVEATEQPSYTMEDLEAGVPDTEPEEPVAEQAEAAADEQEAPAKEAVEEAAPEPAKADPGAKPDILDGVSDEIRKHVKGLEAEMVHVRQGRKDALEEGDRRVAKVLADIQEKVTAKPEEPMPDPDYDPDGYRERLEAKNKELQEAATTQGQTADQVAKVAQINEYTAKVESEFRVEHPEYDQAFAHLEKAELDGFRRLGYSEQMAREEVNKRGLQLMQVMYERGGNAAQYVLTKAMDSGFKPNGGEAVTEAAPESNGAQQGERLAAGEAAAKSLGKGGAAPDDAMTAEKLSTLKGDEFDKAFDQHVAMLRGERVPLFG